MVSYLELLTTSPQRAINLPRGRSLRRGKRVKVRPDDRWVKEALRHNNHLVLREVPDKEVASKEVPEKPLEKMTKKQLLAYARSIDPDTTLSNSMLKAELYEAVVELDENNE